MVPDAIILATARCAELTLATRNSRDFPLELGAHRASLPALSAGLASASQRASRR